MPYKDKKLRMAASMKSRAKKPDLYKALDQKKERARCQRGYHIKRRYGITMDEVDAMILSQNNCCIICGKIGGKTVTGRTNLHVDHNHSTGKVRGLICGICNLLVGYWEQPNGPELFSSVGAYVKNNS